MKRMTQLLMVSLFALSLTFTSCKKDKGVGTQSCLDASQKWMDAAQAFGANSTSEAKCNNLKSTWKTYVSKCNIKDYMSDAEYREYIESLDELDCSDLN